MAKRVIGAIRARVTYANVAATLALVFAMSGGALAAKHYLINSTKQINPKVLKKLRGPRGAIGPNGAIGPQGVTGPEGLRGPRGEKGVDGFSALTLLPKGATESGDFTVSAPTAEAKAFVRGAETFSIPLTAALENSQVEVTPVGEKTANCLGRGLAERGWLCIYTSRVQNLKFLSSYNPEAPGTAGSGRFGFGMIWEAEAGGEVEATGTWSVTAP